MKISENVKNHWTAKRLTELGYKVTLTHKGVVRNDEMYKDDAYILNITENPKSKYRYNVNFGIKYTTIKFSDGTVDDGWFVYDQYGEMINDELDYSDALDECVTGCFYYFLTRY